MMKTRLVVLLAILITGRFTGEEATARGVSGRNSSKYSARRIPGTEGRKSSRWNVGRDSVAIHFWPSSKWLYFEVRPVGLMNEPRRKMSFLDQTGANIAG